MPRSGGFALIELVIGLVLLGLIAGLSVVGITAAVERHDPAQETLARARRNAAISGRPVALIKDSVPLLLLPDGRTIADSAVALYQP